jgi:hypothetical protein
MIGSSALVGFPPRRIGLVALLVSWRIIATLVGVVSRGIALLVHLARTGVGWIGLVVDLWWFLAGLRLHGIIGRRVRAAVALPVSYFLVVGDIAFVGHASFLIQ